VGRYRKAMSASTELTQQDKKREALRLLDDAIAMAEVKMKADGCSL
jgi:hypothetical protein